MANTHLNDECIESFAELLGGTITLQSVDFSYTDITNAGIIELSNNVSFKNNDSIVILNFGENDMNIEIEEDIITVNPNINFILERNKNLYWHPCYYNTDLFNNDSHKMIMTTLLCNYHESYKVRLPMSVLIYIFKFFNRSKFLNI